ncbi:MAG TPA: HAD family hydrolase [Acidimicrobiales bacterium]|nr:HAD family hydrolase [Acidimicrobiales bacterium]
MDESRAREAGGGAGGDRTAGDRTAGDRTAGGGRAVDAVLCDRDGTLVADVPYNGDPGRVRPLPGVRRGLARLRAAGVRLAIVSNQSGVARGLLTACQVEEVNARVVDLLGPFDAVLWCGHGPADRCPCRKPEPGLVLAAARATGTPVARCAVVGDIGADVLAARAAGARAVLVPTAVTRPDEVAAAPCVAADFPAAVDLLLGRGSAGAATAAGGGPASRPPRSSP